MGGGAITKVGTREERVDSALDVGNPLGLQSTVQPQEGAHRGGSVNPRRMAHFNMRGPWAARGGDGQAEGMSISSHHWPRDFSFGARVQLRWVLGLLACGESSGLQGC